MYRATQQFHIDANWQKYYWLCLSALMEEFSIKI